MNFAETLKIHQCRTCYNATKGLKLLTDLTKCSESQEISYAELLSNVSHINIMEDLYNKLPQFICEVCLRKLKAAQAFIQQAHAVNERLLAMLNAQREQQNNQFIDNQCDDALEIPVQVKMEFDGCVVAEAEPGIQWQEETDVFSQGELNGTREDGAADDTEFFKIRKVVQNNNIHIQLNQMFGILNKKIDLLADNNEILKNQLKDIRNQNSMVLDVLSENTDVIEKSLNKHPKYLKMFPINTIEELNEIEENICEQNESEYITSIRAIAGQRGLKKGLSDIMCPKLLIDFNVDGSHNKLRLLNYTKFVNVLFHGTYDENSTEKSFKCLLRDALKLVKNRYFKEKCISNKNDNLTKKIGYSKR